MHDADSADFNPEEDFPELASQLREALSPPPHDELFEERDAAFRKELRGDAPVRGVASVRGEASVIGGRRGPTAVFWKPAWLPLLGLAAALAFGCFLVVNQFNGPQKAVTSQLESSEGAEADQIVELEEQLAGNPNDINQDGSVDALDAYLLASRGGDTSKVEELMTQVVALN